MNSDDPIVVNLPITTAPMTVSERRAALRQLVALFGLMNTMIELSAGGAPRSVAEHAATARDLVGELVADLAAAR
ncbi:hypothetical protein ACFVJ5_25775 [Nocardia sp. NPDC127606]|uniref:hypothetical protein n=2 Tax=unclassified Nocardia TaxID=2637762 RepID=UPI0036455C4B